MKWPYLKIQDFISKPSIEEVAAYQHKMPRKISVEASFDKKTGFWTAKITEIDDAKSPGLIITESKTESGLVEMVNDAILTYLDFPERMKRSMPSLLPEDINFDKKVSKKNNLVFAK